MSRRKPRKHDTGQLDMWRSHDTATDELARRRRNRRRESERASFGYSITRQTEMVMEAPAGDRPVADALLEQAL